MQLKHTALIAALLGIASTSFAADQTVIGLITKTETNPFFVKMKEGAEAAAKAKGAKLLSAAGKTDGDNAGQVTAMENMIAAGAKTILITPSDSKAIVPAIEKARAKGVMVIALDSPTDPQDATDALFATDNYKAGVLIGQYAKAALGGKPAKIATLDLFPGHPVGAQRHNGFLQGFGLQSFDAKNNELAAPTEVVCMADSFGDRAKGQTAMENCLQKAPDINVVYTINEPAAAGAYQRPQARRQGRGRGHRLGRRRLRRYQERRQGRDLRDQPAISAEDGLDGRRCRHRICKNRQEGQRLHRHRRHVDRRQTSGRRREQGRQDWHLAVLGQEISRTSAAGAQRTGWP